MFVLCFVIRVFLESCGDIYYVFLRMWVCYVWFLCSLTLVIDRLYI